MTRAEKDIKLAELEERKSNLYSQRSKLSRSYEEIQTSRSTIDDQMQTGKATLNDLESRDNELKREEGSVENDIKKLDSAMADVDREIEETINADTDD